jgi:hypothetical protein
MIPRMVPIRLVASFRDQGHRFMFSSNNTSGSYLPASSIEVMVGGAPLSITVAPLDPGFFDYTIAGRYHRGILNTAQVSPNKVINRVAALGDIDDSFRESLMLSVKCLLSSP